jgi:O-antigen/teichoic acid export membrane protein
MKESSSAAKAHSRLAPVGAILFGVNMKLLEGVAWSAIRGWGSRVINLAVFFVSVRYLTPAEIGIFSLVAAYLMVFQVLGEGGLADFIVQRNEDNHHQDSAIFYAQIATSLTIGLALAGVSPWVAPLLIDHTDAVLIFAVTAATIPPRPFRWRLLCACRKRCYANSCDSKRWRCEG